MAWTSIRTPQSGIHTAKSRIHVLVMRLEPVTKRGPQHASGGAGRTAFHHKVFAVKKIGRIASVERKWFKAGERREHSGGPFPAVSQKAFYAEGALAQRMRVHRRGVPMGKIKISQARVRSVTAPGIGSLHVIRRSIRRTVPLRFRRQLSA